MSNTQQFDDRLESLLTLRGPELMHALVKELRDLNRELQNLKCEVEALRTYRIAKQRWLASDSLIKSTVSLPASACVTAAELLYQSNGFYSLEHTREGIAFRWTGPSRSFSFDLFVDRMHGAELELRALSCVDFERQKNIVVMVDGERVSSNVERRRDSVLLTAELPTSADGTASHLEFVVPEVIPPPESDDSRLLGISFTSLLVKAHPKPAVGADDSEKTVGVEIIELVPRSQTQ
ncbi:MAG TPA: hypothetical protein VGM17_11180 [Rhizomicrobium sp.]|jgi:hypothetical protein